MRLEFLNFLQSIRTRDPDGPDGVECRFELDRHHRNDSDALDRFFTDVQSGAFPSTDETYHMSEESFEALLALMYSDGTEDG